MPLLDWSDPRFTLGHAEMDETHREFVALVNALDGVADGEFRRRFTELCAHTAGHFAREEALMDETRFPSAAEHKDEHRKVLGEMEQFRRRVERGVLPLGRAYVRERLPEWFALHAATMDSALAAHLKVGR